MGDILKEHYDEFIDSKLDELWEIAKYIHRNPEVAFEEEKACKIQVDYLKKNDFFVETGVGGLKTAFKATYSHGNGGLNLCIVSEYDALPGIGHACGHNLISSTALGTAISTKKFLIDSGINGSIHVIGTPAEESGGGKIILLRNGVFDEIDSVIMMHPTSDLTRLAGECMSSMSLEIEFIGQKSHASSHPDKGKNALSAANLYFVSTGLLRQSFKEITRLSGYIESGGESSGMIPDYVKIKGSISSFNLQRLEKDVEKVKRCAEGSAHSLGCEVKFKVKPGYQGRIPNTTLSDICRKQFEELSEPLLDGMPFDYGGEDLGNVSRVIPICNPYTTIFPEYKISNHTEQFKDLANSEAGKRCIQVSSKAMSRTLMEQFMDPTIVEEAKKELETRIKKEKEL